MLCFSRSNSWATTSTLKPSPWRSPTQTDRRRNESAWRKERSRLLPSLANRHFPLISKETTSLSAPWGHLETKQVQWATGLYFQFPKTQMHTHTSNIGEQLTVEPMRRSCFLRKCASLLGQDQHEHILYIKTHGRRIFCCNAEMWQVFLTHTHAVLGMYLVPWGEKHWRFLILVTCQI